jgi:hypothetical protein
MPYRYLYAYSAFAKPFSRFRFLSDGHAVITTQALLMLSFSAVCHIASAQRASHATQQKYHTHYAPKPAVAKSAQTARSNTIPAPK